MKLSMQSKTSIIFAAFVICFFINFLSIQSWMHEFKLMEDGSLNGIITLRNLSLAFFVFSLLAAGAAFFYIKKSIIGRIAHAVSELEKLSKYDLRHSREHIHGNDEIAGLLKNTAHIQDYWEKVLSETLNISSEVSVSSSILWASLNNNMKSIEHQKKQTEMIATASSELSQTSMDISKNAASTADISKKVSESAESSMATMNSAAESINGLASSTETLGNMIQRLDSRIGEISEITSLINDIADQTNLLALNAAIEAARAGEQGRGFAVVADEVRKLAENTIKATSDITEKTKGIQAESEGTASQMEIAKQKMEESIKFINDTKDALHTIVEYSKSSSDQITNIAAAVEEQSATTEETTQGIEVTSEIANKILDDTKVLFQGVTTLNNEIDKLINNNSIFQLPEDALFEIASAKIAHKKWVNRLYKMYYGGEHIDVSEVTDHKKCRFGKWYYGTGASQCSGSADFTAIEGPHRELHQKAKSAVEDFHRGDKAASLNAIEEVDRISRDIVSHLDNIKSYVLSNRHTQSYQASPVRMIQEHPAAG